MVTRKNDQETEMCAERQELIFGMMEDCLTEVMCNGISEADYWHMLKNICYELFNYMDGHMEFDHFYDDILGKYPGMKTAYMNSRMKRGAMMKKDKNNHDKRYTH